MLRFLQPIASLFIGLALSVYGLSQSLLHAPSTQAFQAALGAMPDAVAVLVFCLGIAAIGVGGVLLISGVRGVRDRAREIKRTYGSPRRRLPPDDYTEDWDQSHPAYR